jgi:hypothetical protein
VANPLNVNVPRPFESVRKLICVLRNSPPTMIVCLPLINVKPSVYEETCWRFNKGLASLRLPKLVKLTLGGP